MEEARAGSEPRCPEKGGGEVIHPERFRGTQSHNIFRLAKYDSMAVPLAIFDSLLANPQTKDSALTLYFYLLRSARTDPVRRIYTGTILLDTKMSHKTFVK